MRLLSKIAFRNLFRHKGRSLSIGFVLVTGAFFMTLGNGTVAGLGFLKEYKEIKDTVLNKGYVERYSPIILGSASLLDLSKGQDQSDLEMISFFGIDPENFNRVYGNSIEIVEGWPLNKGERGICINVKLRERIYNMYDVWLVPTDAPVKKENLSPDAPNNMDTLRTRNDLVLMGMNGSITATDVRVPIKGVFKYTNMNEMFNTYNLVDIETARECMGYLSAEEIFTNLSEEKKSLLNAVDQDPDSLIFENDVFDMNGSDNSKTDYTAMLKQKGVTKKPESGDSGIYSLVQINLTPEANLEQAVNDLNKSFMKAGINEYVRAVSWKHAWSRFYGNAKINQTLLMVFVYIVYFAAVLMMANALSMAAMERTTEIGTMRMVGSKKGFIARMFLMETSFLSFIFGGLGIILGIIAIKILAGMEFTSTSFDLQTLFGGNKYCPHVDVNGILTGIIQLMIISIIAVIYPVIVARRIKPLDAIKRN
jgi:ABC-type lipoprotein release transport system permease subunit